MRFRRSRRRAVPRTRLIVLHTSDISGRVHPHDPRADRHLGQGLARIATAVEGIRAEGPVLPLDSGDTINPRIAIPAARLKFI
ncbi:MAG: hypothetical protein ABR576_09215 [Thermoanaerobaculia bacterium]